MDLIIQLGRFGGACLAGDDSWMAEGLQQHTHTLSMHAIELTYLLYEHIYTLCTCAHMHVCNCSPSRHNEH